MLIGFQGYANEVIDIHIKSNNDEIFHSIECPHTCELDIYTTLNDEIEIIVMSDLTTFAQILPNSYERINIVVDSKGRINLICPD